MQLAPNNKDASQKMSAAQQKLGALITQAKQAQASGDLGAAIADYQAAGTYQQADQQITALSQTKSAADTAYDQGSQAFDKQQ